MNPALFIYIPIPHGRPFDADGAAGGEPGSRSALPNLLTFADGSPMPQARRLAAPLIRDNEKCLEIRAEGVLHFGSAAAACR